MLKDLIFYFLPDKYKNGSSYEPKSLDSLRNSSFLIALILLCCTSALILSAVKALIFAEFGLITTMGLLLSAILVGLLFVHKKYDYYKTISIASCLILYSFIVWRSYLCCGFKSPFMNLFIGLPLFFGVILNKNTNRSFLALLNGTVLFMFATTKDLPPVLPERFVFIQLIVMLIGINTVYIAATFFKTQKSRFLDIFFSHEKQKIVCDMVTLYNHEIINPLSKARGHLEIYKLDQRKEQIAKIENALDEIEKIIDDINEINKDSSHGKGEWNNLDHLAILKKKAGMYNE